MGFLQQLFRELNNHQYVVEQSTYQFSSDEEGNG
jgi:hypothetical protein